MLLFKVDEETMYALKSQAKSDRVVTYTVCDAGRTQIEAGSETVTSLGPDFASKLLPLTMGLKPL